MLANRIFLTSCVLYRLVFCGLTILIVPLLRLETSIPSSGYALLLITYITDVHLYE